MTPILTNLGKTFLTDIGWNWKACSAELRLVLTSPRLGSLQTYWYWDCQSVSQSVSWKVEITGQQERQWGNYNEKQISLSSQKYKMFCEFCSTDISGWSHLDKYFHFLRHYKVKLGSWYTNLAQYYNDRNLVRNHQNSWYARLLSKISILRISEKCWILQTIIKSCK